MIMTDQLDTIAIRGQMAALTGFTPEHWNADQVRQNARLIAAAPDMHEAITALSERCRVLEEALSGLEWACDQLASTRTHEVYLAMIDSGQADALLSLDARRQAARAALAQKEGK